MISLFGSRRLAANRALIDRLNDVVVAAVREPAFYTAGGVPDTFNGRFELLVLHAALVVRRLRALPSPGPAMAQDLVDTLFRNLDPTLRELGVGDMAVPKRMKRLAEAFLGRSMAYEQGLAAPDPASLPAALSRNVHADGRAAHDLAAYVREAATGLDRCDLAAFTRGAVRFPDPAAFLVQDAVR